MNTNFSRRTFLKTSCLLSASIAAANMLPDKFLLWAEEQGMLKATYVPTLCEVCFWKCGAIAKVINGRVVKMEGNPAHPASRGKLCGRGNGGAGSLYDPNRLKTPLINTGARGEGKFKKASWDEALNLTAEKMLKIKAKYGPESMALFTHASPSAHFMPLLFAYGSKNFAMPGASQCRASRDIGMELTFGENNGSPERVDMPNAKVVVLLGAHLGENMHNSHVQDYAEAVGRGAKFIVVDPRFSTAAGKAEKWLPIRPATDTALLLTWINIIISEGMYDKEYVAQYTTGFEELRNEMKQYTPEWAATETDLKASDILATARMIGKNAPAVCIHPGRHVAWYGDDVQRSRAIGILWALLGSWGREGGQTFPSRASFPKSAGKPYPEPTKEAINLGFPFAPAEGVTNNVRNVTLTGNPYPVKGWMVTGTNLMKSLPNQKETLDAIKQLDLLLVVDTMPFDTAMLADILLPECTYLERHDELAVGSGKSLSISLRQPAVEPMYESKPGWWIAKELAKRLGVGEYFAWNHYEEKIKSDCVTKGIDYEKLKQVGTITIPDTAKPYITPDNPPVFNTKSGKIELVSLELKEKGFDAIPKYIKHPQPKDGEFRLIYGRSPVHTFCRTTNNPELHELYPENEVWISATKAKAMGIEDGSYVSVTNQDGAKIPSMRAKVTERIREDCVYMVHGFGTQSKELKLAYNKGGDDQSLITKYAVDPISGTTGMRVNFVRIEKGVKNA